MFGRAFEKTWRVVSASLRLRTKKHDLIASNIANVDTPGYRRKDLPFEKVMRAYLGKEDFPLKRTRPEHISNLERELKALVVEPKDIGTPNNVSLEEELSKLVENHIMYQATVQAFLKEVTLMREAITEGGR